MTDPKKTEDNDIVAKADDAPEVVQDDELEDIEGGVNFRMASAVSHNLTVSGNAATLGHLEVTDHLVKEKAPFFKEPGPFFDKKK